MITTKWSLGHSIPIVGPPRGKLPFLCTQWDIDYVDWIAAEIVVQKWLVNQVESLSHPTHNRMHNISEKKGESFHNS